MNELIKITSNINFIGKMPIEVLLKVNNDNTISSKRVFEFLNMNPKNYSRWCKTNMDENEFAEEGTDYVKLFIKEELSGQSTTDYKLSIPFAKKLCMLSKSERGEQARDYL